MPAPARFTSGITQSPSWTIMGKVGVPNPFFYNQFYTDFTIALPSASTVVTTTGTGSAVYASGDGGIRTLSSNTSANAFTSEQLATAPFTLPGVSGKRLVFGGRISISNTSNTNWVLGLQGINTTPFASVADGIWFSGTGTSSGSLVVLNIASGGITYPSTINSFYIPPSGVYFDVICEISSQGRIVWAVTPNSMGYISQSGTSNPNSIIRQPTINSTIPVANQSTANLAPIWAVQTTNNLSGSMSVDYVFAMKER